MKRKQMIIGAVVAVILLIALGGGLMASHMSKVTKAEGFFDGVTVEGIDLSGLTKEEAKAKLDEQSEKLMDTPVTLGMLDKTDIVSLRDLGMTYDNQKIVDKAYALGRDGNLFQNYMDVKNLEKKGVDYTLEFTFDETALQEALETKTDAYENKMQNASIKRENGKFVITEEKDGIVVDSVESGKLIIDKVTNDWADRAAFQIDMVTKEEKAKYTKEMMEKITDQLGTYSTSYSTSAYGRKKNVKAGADYINGTVLYPGDEFNMYNVVTPFTADRGYAMAGSYLNGETVQSMGGGICQVSTTLYNAVIRAELEITERHEHSMTVSYVPLSADAAIAGTYKNLKFKNNLETPVYIESKADGRNLTFTVWGEETRDPNRTIDFDTEVLSTTASPEVEEPDPTLEEGVRKVISKGHTGYKTKLWKIVKVNGTETERVLMNESRYKASNTKVAVGTMPVDPNAVPADPNAVPAPVDPNTTPAPVDPNTTPAPTDPSTTPAPADPNAGQTAPPVDPNGAVAP